MKLIDVSTKKFPNAFAMVDDADFHWLNQWKWSAISSGGGSPYAIRRDHAENKNIMMHVLIMGKKDGKEIDHKNRNTLDNQKSNLRFATKSQNGANRECGKSKCGYKGVRFHKGTWEARIGVLRKMVHVGCFKTPIQAAQAYNDAAKKFFGEFALLNQV